jgi:hypothetical protein
MNMRNPQLDHLIRTRGFYIAFYDPTGDTHGIPTYPWRCAPQGYATIRQLRAQGLRPGGQQIRAQILWRHRKTVRTAHLYRIADAKPKRTASPAQLDAIAKALRARRTCPSCGQERNYYIPTSLGCCLSCDHDARYGRAA